MAFIRYNGRKKHEYVAVMNVKVQETNDIMERDQCERRGEAGVGRAGTGAAGVDRE